MSNVPLPEPYAHLVVIKTDAGPTKFFTAPSDPRGFPVYLAPPAAPAPDGWVMAPREPTEEMIQAAAGAWGESESGLHNAFAAALRGGIAASPAAPAAPVPDGWVMVPRKELGDGISLLHQAMVGACDCLTKTHEAKYHAESCFYRRLSEQCDKLEATIAAAPAQPAVPLTEGRITGIANELAFGGGHCNVYELARAIEAAHGITGGKP